MCRPLSPLCTSVGTIITITTITTMNFSFILLKSIAAQNLPSVTLHTSLSRTLCYSGTSTIETSPHQRVTTVINPPTRQHMPMVTNS
jgi:hypothetical protein